MYRSKRIRISLSELLILISIFIIAIFLLIDKPNNLDSTLNLCYNHVCIQWFIFGAIWTVIFLEKKIDIFEPIVLVTVIHFIFFEITPLICINSEDILFFGENVWDACVKGTYISTLGYVFYVLLYFGKRYKKNAYNYIDNRIDYIRNRNTVLRFNYLVWIFSFLCGLLLIYGYGLNIKYLLTGGISTLEDATNERSAFGFLGIFFYAMIPSYLYILELSNSKLIKIILFYLTFMSYYVRGFRFIMIACIMSPIIFMYLKKKKRPSARMLLLMMVGLIVFSSYVQFTRMSIRAGMGVGAAFSEIISLKSISDVVIDNFEIVKTYYALVKTFPDKAPFTMGAEIFITTALIVVPSAIWPGKPPAPIYEVITSALNETARRSGTAFPYLGEYYFEFGTIGVCFFMGLLGVLLRKLKSFMHSSNVHDMIMYSSLYPLLFQVLIRGYTPTNFYMMFFVFLPVYFSKRFFDIDKRM